MSEHIDFRPLTVADFERSQQGICREKDFAAFVRNEVGAWRGVYLRPKAAR